MESPYIWLVIFGGLGFAAMVVFGSLHIGHANVGHAPVGHGHAGHVHFGHGHAGHCHATGQAPAHSTHKGPSMFIPSPLDIFSLVLGAGATGVFLGDRLESRLTILAAIVGALFFNFLIVRPIMGVLMRFASKPSEGLEGALATVGEAASKFDSQGQGLVKLTIDGQVVQLLGILDSTEADRKEPVLPGDPLLVVNVDATRNRCRVIRQATR